VAGRTTANNGLIDIEADGMLTVGTVGARTGLDAHGTGDILLSGVGIAVNEDVQANDGDVELAAQYKEPETSFCSRQLPVAQS